MRQLDERARDSAGAPFMQATPDARLALLTALDREQHETASAARRARRARAAGWPRRRQPRPAEPKEGDKFLPDARQQNAPSAEVGAGAAERSARTRRATGSG
jgi:hypothetical protein